MSFWEVCLLIIMSPVAAIGGALLGWKVAEVVFRNRLKVSA